jgi:hypothetical protein
MPSSREIAVRALPTLLLLFIFAASDLAAAPATPGSPAPGSASSPGPTVAGSSVVLSWNASTGATYYSVAVRNMATNALVVDTTTGNTSYTASLSAATPYRWNVAACNGTGCSAYTTVLYFQTPSGVPLTPASPAPGSASSPGPAVASSSVVLSWSASTGATYYAVAVRDMATNALVVDTTTGNTSYTASLSAATPYRWNVAACNGAGCSAYTTVLYFQTPSGVPLTPASPAPGSASSPGPAVAGSSVVLSWSVSAGATYYSVAVRDMVTNALVVDTTTGSPSYTASLSAATPYRWNVAACNGAGCSAYTTVLYFQTPSGVPLTPASPAPGTAGSPGPVVASSSVVLSWSVSAGATYYAVAVRDMATNALVVDTTTGNTSYTASLSAVTPYRWNVAACNSAGCSAYTTVLYFQTPSSGVPLTPASPAPGSASSPGPTVASPSVVLSWSASAGATYYAVAVRNMTTNALVVDTTTGNTSYTASLSALTPYRWNVAACNGAGCSAYTTVLYFQTPSVTTLGPPVPSSPGSASGPGPTLSTLTPQFTWTGVNAASGYGLYIRDLTTNVLVYPNASGTTSTPLGGTSFNLPNGYLVESHSYRWSMTSFNGSSETAQSTTTLYFQTQTTAGPPTPPTPAAPGSAVSPGPTLTTLTPQFTWSAVGGATGYGLYIRDVATNNFIYPNASGTTSTPLGGTTFNLPAGYLVEGRAYRWSVTSFSGVVESSQSAAVLYFQTQGPTSSFDPPTPVAPGTATSPGPTLSTLTPQFTWNAAQGASGYGLYISDLTTNRFVFPNAAGTTTTPLGGTSFTLPAGFLVSGHAYRWLMTSFNGSAESTRSATILYFTVQTSGGTAPNPPTPLSPGNQLNPGPPIQTLTPLFTWTGAQGASGYGLYVRDVTTNELIYPNAAGTTSVPLTGTSFNLPLGYLVNGHAYRWSMTSFDGATQTGQSATVLYFTVSLPSTPDAPQINFKADPDTIDSGGSSTLIWTTAKATAVTIDQGLGGQPLNGSLAVRPAATTTYTLTATGNGGSSTAQATVTIRPPAGSITVGGITFDADSITTSAEGYSLKGSITIGRVIAYNGSLSIKNAGASQNFSMVGDGKLTVPGVTLPSGTVLVLYDGNFTIPFGKSKLLAVPETLTQLRIGGWKLRMDEIGFVTDGITVAGSLRIPQLVDGLSTVGIAATAELTRAGGIRLLGGSLKVAKIQLTNVYSLEQIDIEYDRDQHLFTGKGILKTPSFGLTVGVTVRDGCPDAIEITINDRPVPFDDTGLQIDNYGVQGTSLCHIHDGFGVGIHSDLTILGFPDPELLGITKVRLTYYPPLSLVGSGKLTVLKSDLGDANLIFNYGECKAGLCVDGTLALPSLENAWLLGRLEASILLKPFRMNGSAQSVVQIPECKLDGFWGGATCAVVDNVCGRYPCKLGETKLALTVQPSGDPAASFVGKVYVKRVGVGIRVNYSEGGDKKLHFHAGVGSNFLGSSSLKKMSADATANTVTIVTGLPDAFVAYRDENANVPTAIALTSPSGKRYGRTGGTNIDYFESLDHHTAVFALLSPEAGSWTLDAGTGGGTFGASSSSRPAVVALRSIVAAGSDYSVTWNATTPDGGGIASLVYARSVDGPDAGIIADGVTPNSADQVSQWRTADVPPGDYFLRIRALNRDSLVSTFTSPVPVKVQGLNALDAPANLAATLSGESDVDLTWSASPSGGVAGYAVLIRPGGTTNAAEKAVGDVLADHVSGLDRSLGYEFSVAAYDEAGHMGRASNVVPVSWTPCNASMTASAPSIAAISDAVDFAATTAQGGCAGTASVRWTYGDGATGAGSRSTHTYASLGTYTWTAAMTVASVARTSTGTIRIGSQRCSLAISQPGPGTLVAGQPVSIGWSQSGACSNSTRIDLVDRTGRIYNLARGVSGTVFPWLPSQTSGDYYVRVSDEGNADYSAVSQTITILNYADRHPVVVHPGGGGAVGEYAPDANTIALLHMNESGGSLINDASGNSRSGAATGTTVANGRFGLGRRLKNDVNAVATEWISLGSSPALNPTSGMTFEAWINPVTGAAGLENEIPIVARGDSALGNEAYFLGISGSCDGVTNSVLLHAGQLSVCSSSGVTINQWTHVAFTLSTTGAATTARLYLNGKLSGEQTVSGGIKTNALTTYIGRRWGTAAGAKYNRGFNGIIDEVRISDRARPAVELNSTPP